MTGPTSTPRVIEAVLAAYAEELGAGDRRAWFDYFADDVIFTKSGGPSGYARSVGIVARMARS